MKSTLLLLLLPAATLGSILKPRACNADNCARAVTGTVAFLGPSSIRQADCSSFQLTTVTPAATTTTVFVTITAAPVRKRVDDALLVARQATVTPVNIPTYASACSGSVRYKSACACWGITPTVTTAPTPTSTYTSTVTVQPNSCSSGEVCGTFVVIEDPSCGPVGDCACAVDADGRSICVQDVFCGSTPTCTTDADCPSGGLCWAQSCCGENVCTVASTVCPNNGSPKLMFRGVKKAMKKSVKRDDGCPTGLQCDPIV